jgi:hypothetical protein
LQQQTAETATYQAVMPRSIPFSFCSTVTLVVQPSRRTDIPYLWRERLQEGFVGDWCSGTRKTDHLTSTASMELIIGANL